MRLLIMFITSAIIAAILWAFIGIVAGGFNLLQWHWGFRLMYAILMLLVLIHTINYVHKKL